MDAGSYCKSGIAFINDNTSAICVEILNITTNIDGFVANQSEPYYCNLTFEYYL